MVATNSISYKTGNISAGTSIFAMVVLEKHLSKIYEEIDMVTTPDGKPVAMVHCNNCTGDINAWVSLFGSVLALFGKEVSAGDLYTKLYEASLGGSSDCGGILSCNYLAGEVLTGLDRGVPMLLRKPDANFSLENFMRAQIYSSLATLRLGMDIFKQENVEISRLTAHGGLLKTPGVAQKYMAAAFNTDIVCLETSGEGGPYGMALLAAYMNEKREDLSLDSFLERRVFNNAISSTESVEEKEASEFNKYIEKYKKMLEVERVAVENI
jgi:sugar (pentulose or hexulose) kinase